MLGVLLACLPFLAAANPLKLQPVMDGIVATPFLSVLEDSTAALTIDEVSNTSWQHRFTPLAGDNTAYGVSASAWWVRLEVENNRAEPIAWILEFMHNMTDFVDAYQLSDEGIITQIALGDHRPFIDRPLPSETFSFPFLTESAQHNTIYLRLKYQPAGIINIYQEISTPEAYSQAQHSKAIWLGGFLGAILLVILYNLFAAVSIREAFYVWYLLYASAATIMYLSLSGLGARYLWGNSPILSDAIPFAGLTLSTLFAIQFSRSFLNTQHHAPRIDRLLMMLMALIGCSIMLLVFNMRVLALNLLLVAGLLVGLLPLMGGWLWYQGHKIARGYTLAWSIWSLAIISGILRFKGILPTDPTGINMTRFGWILEAILLSFVMADRINILRSQKHDAEERERLASAKSKEELETKVLERTHELEGYRQQAEELARKDSLTGLLNHRSFFERGHEEVNRAIRYEQPLSVLMLDIDRFKAVNDSFGHAAGDEVIKAVANILTSVLRESDIKARIGGEEFAVVFVQTEYSAALLLAERLRHEIEQCTVVTEKAKINVTSSFGVCQLTGVSTSLENLLESADQALYSAKKNGRNRVVEAIPSIVPKRSAKEVGGNGAEIYRA